jgi:hypothetical protein
MPLRPPTAETRWRCALCGNLTRFDVERTVRSRDYVHVDLAGAAVVEERQVIVETIEQVTCRWCGNTDSVELVPRPAAEAAGGVSGAAVGVAEQGPGGT